MPPNITDRGPLPREIAIELWGGHRSERVENEVCFPVDVAARTEHLAKNRASSLPYRSTSQAWKPPAGEPLWRCVQVGPIGSEN
jgi:hypothetical protein